MPIDLKEALSNDSNSKKSSQEGCTEKSSEKSGQEGSKESSQEGRSEKGSKESSQEGCPEESSKESSEEGCSKEIRNTFLLLNIVKRIRLRRGCRGGCVYSEQPELFHCSGRTSLLFESVLALE
ncbi:MAG TPA: hypothetical protein PKZ12_06935 [Smithellaceae bacterium]|nr:hypothetical protein [Smithellaceae bacterium]